MKNNCTKIIIKIQKIKRKTRDREVRFKLELFILAHKLNNVTEACARRGVGRTYYYKWWKRFNKSKFKLESLAEKPRIPKKSPLKTKKSLELKVQEYHSKGYGARILQAILKRENKKLSTSTICHILNGRKKLKKKSSKKFNPHRRRYEMPIPGQRVQIDVKYVPKLIRGKRMYCFSGVDECTRYKYSFIYASLSEYSSFDFLEKLKEDFPFPINCIQSDNGFEFTNRFNRYKDRWDHSVAVWCKENEVNHRLIPPGAKELNGKIERSHRIDEQYFYWRAPELSLEAINTEMAVWLKVYNQERPHGGIKYKTPMEKLRERMANLRNEKVDDRLRLIKARFLLECPVMLLKKERPQDYKIFKFAA